MIYLDNNATTEIPEPVIEAMLRYCRNRYSNASASTAVFTGADRPRRDAALAMATLLCAEGPECFAFTSGATESNNWVFYSLSKSIERGTIIISEIEHPSLSEPALELEKAGFDLKHVPVRKDGTIRLDAFEEALTGDTLLVSIMAANNETGVLQPLTEVGRLIRKHSPSALFHTDATQAVGKIPINLEAEWQEVDLLSFSAHKFHGPKGIGGLYVRPGIRIHPMLLGGGQEDGSRSGTTNTPGLAGLAVAADAAKDFPLERVKNLRDWFEERLEGLNPFIQFHGRRSPRIANTSYFSLPDIDAEDVVERLATRGIVCGTGSACSAGAIHSSKTLRAMGVQDNVAKRAVRVSLSRFTTQEEMDTLITRLSDFRAEFSSLEFPSERQLGTVLPIA